jgi:hypothetical protein
MQHVNRQLNHKPELTLRKSTYYNGALDCFNGTRSGVIYLQDMRDIGGGNRYSPRLRSKYRTSEQTVAVAALILRTVEEALDN